MQVISVLLLFEFPARTSLSQSPGLNWGHLTNSNTEDIIQHRWSPEGNTTWTILFLNLCTSLRSEGIIAHLDPLIWLNAICWWLYQHKAAIMLLTDSFPHLNNSISEAASRAQGAWWKDDWQICEDVIHEKRWERVWKSRERERERESARLSFQPWSLPFIVSPQSLFYFFPPLLRVVMTILNTVSMEKGWARALSPFHHFIHMWKGSILAHYLVWWINRLWIMYGFMTMSSRARAHSRRWSIHNT